MGKKFVDEFAATMQGEQNSVTDYDAFSDKELLEELRNKIIQGLIDKHSNDNTMTTLAIRQEVDNAVVGYDLTIIERSYLYNLIDNEVNGYGPITELLEDKDIT